MFSSLFWHTWSQPAQSVREGCIHGCTFHNTPIPSSPCKILHQFSQIVCKASDRLSANWNDVNKNVFPIKACFQKFCHETRYLRNFGDTSSGDSSCGQRCVPLRNLTLESQGWLSRDQVEGACWQLGRHGDQLHFPSCCSSQGCSRPSVDQTTCQSRSRKV